MTLISGRSSGTGHCTAHGLQKHDYRVLATACQQENIDMLPV
ncbi:hypothetical protein [Nitrosomonas eutropha]|nr:hypothetical protein [Nitrosomonas eutropha]